MRPARPFRFYFDYLSPYAYLCWTQIHALAAKHGREVEPIPVLLAPILQAMDTRGPAEIPAKRAYMIKDVVRLAHQLDVPIELPPAHPFNPLLALRVSSLPMEHESRHALVNALFHAAWGGGSGIGERDQVATICSAVGLAGDAVIEAESIENKARVRQQTDEALAAGAFGVPTIVVDHELFFGLDSLPHLDRWLRGIDPVTPELVARWARLPAAAIRRIRTDIERTTP